MAKVSTPLIEVDCVCLQCPVHWPVRERIFPGILVDVHARVHLGAAKSCCRDELLGLIRIQVMSTLVDSSACVQGCF